MRKGFTLIELMAVIVIISLVCLLTFPNIVNQIEKSKDANKDNIEEVVISSAKKYVNDNIDKYSEQRDYCISVEELVDNDYLKEDIVNDEENNLLDWYVKVNYDNDFKYKMMNECLAYTTLDYIESTGTQYIDTGIASRDNLKIETNYYINNFNNARNYVFGVYGDSDKYRVQWSHSSTAFAGYGNMWQESISVPIDKITYNLILDKGVFTLNGEVVYDASSATGTYSSTNDKKIYIFAINSNGTIQRLSSIKLYYLKIWDNDSLIRDFIPVLDSDGVACLYDKVEGKYYYNQGTDEFLYE